jgi:hypothetical protein
MGRPERAAPDDVGIIRSVFLLLLLRANLIRLVPLYAPLLENLFVSRIATFEIIRILSL